MDIEIGKQYTYAKGDDGKGYPVTVLEIRESMSGEKIPYVERVSDQANQKIKFTCPMGDLS